MKNHTKAPLWSRNFIVVSSINLLVMFIYYMLLVTIGSYAVEQFNASSSLAGFVASVMVIGCLIGRFVTGYIIEIVGCKKVLFIGTISFVITMSLYLVANNLPLLILIRFVSGIAVGIIGTVTGTTVVYSIARERHGEGISYFSLSTILAAALGPFLGMQLLRFVDFYTLLYLSIFIGAVSLLISFLLQSQLLNFSQRTSSTHNSLFKLSNYIEPKSINISLIIMILGTGYAAIQTYLSFYAQTLNLLAAASFFFAVYSVAVLVSRPFTGKLLDLKGENIIVYPALIILAIGFVLLSEAHSAFVMLLSSVLIGLGFGNIQSTAQAIAVKVSPSHKVGQATSTFFILFDGGIGIGPYVLGLLVPFVGFNGIYFISAIVCLICIPLYYALHGRKKYQLPVIEETSK